jgi:glycosyltransferase involved in cell wall biosynthesis
MGSNTNQSASPPTRILYIHPYNWRSGPQRSLYELIAHLDKNRFQPIVALPAEGPVSAEFARLGAQIRFEAGIRTIPRSFSPLHQTRFLVETWATARQLGRYIRSDGISLVHVNSEACPVGGLAAKLAKVPALTHLHGLSVLSPESVGKVVTTALNGFNAALIATSNQVRSAYIANGATPGIIHTIYNGIDIRSFDPGRTQKSLRRELSLAEDVPLIGMVANFDPRKGHHDFVRACALVRKKTPQARFVIAGSTNMSNCPGYFEQIRTSASRLGLSDAMSYLGLRNDIPDILASLDVVVQPSLTEAGPIVPIEAMAMERPLVVSNAAGNAEEVVDGQTGLVVPMGDTAAISEAVLRLLDDRPWAESLGKAGRRHALDLFTSEAMAKKTARVYEGLLAGAPRKRPT